MKFLNVTAVALLLALCAAPIVAAESADPLQTDSIGEIGIEFPISKDTRYYNMLLDDEILSVESLDELALIVKERYMSGNALTSSAKINDIYRSLQEYNHSIETNTIVVTDEEVLLEKELIAYICLSDGISASELATAVVDASSAESKAVSKYPTEAGLIQDTYRHFVWNFMMTQDLTQEKARTVGCNYEWGRILLDYAEEVYQDYIDDGFSTTNAAQLSYGYAYDMREYCYALCGASQDYFTLIFTDDSIRDLWNNCYGRAYATEYSSYVTAFNVANNVGELINSDLDVTSSHIWSVWSWDWYTA